MSKTLPLPEMVPEPSTLTTPPMAVADLAESCPNAKNPYPPDGAAVLACKSSVPLEVAEESNSMSEAREPESNVAVEGLNAAHTDTGVPGLESDPQVTVVDGKDVAAGNRVAFGSSRVHEVLLAAGNRPVVDGEDAGHRTKAAGVCSA